MSNRIYPVFYFYFFLHTQQGLHGLCAPLPDPWSPKLLGFSLLFHLVKVQWVISTILSPNIFSVFCPHVSVPLLILSPTTLNPESTQKITSAPQLLILFSKIQKAVTSGLTKAGAWDSMFTCREFSFLIPTSHQNVVSILYALLHVDFSYRQHMSQLPVLQRKQIIKQTHLSTLHLKICMSLLILSSTFFDVLRKEVAYFLILTLGSRSKYY